MDRTIFERIIETINKQKLLHKNEIYEIVTKTENIQVQPETFTSIYSNLKRRQMFKSTDPKSLNWRKLKDNSINLFVRKYNEYEQEENRNKSEYSNLILKIANELMISPVLVSRLILDGMIKLGTLELVETAVANLSKISISQLVKETHLLKNGRLAYEIWECCCVDDDYGPTIDVIRNFVGMEEESKLERILVDKKIAYLKEDELRERGYDKTPDFMLEIPIYLSDGTIVSWIDSKATFGDEQSHKENYDNQFKFYLNRFGAGLVIYSFGLLKDVDKMGCNYNAGTNKRVIYVCEQFPLDYTSFNFDFINEETQ
jgi:hypothetical protein